ncbi:MAG: mandelate racemase/muconate lactonizing enzyme family protein [Actinobacteria bacterium]|nr:mandelate racemase/muconate lactonizing enzyme family protein [Actinomycetota bacterium]
MASTRSPLRAPRPRLQAVVVHDSGASIENISTEVVLVPLTRPVGTSIHQIESVGCVLVTVRTADGVTGEGFCFTIDGARIRAFDEMVKGLAQFAIGRSVFEAGRIWADVWGAINPTGHKGVTVAGFWLSDSTETLVGEAQRFTEMGFRAVKIRVGHDLPTDLERIRTVQSELGDGIAIYTDANQAFEPKEAIRRGLALADAGVTWFEEPVAAGDFAGHAMVRAALPIDVASGETEYTRFGMQQYLDAGSVDVLMPDLQRVGGYTEFKVAASAAAAKNVPISSHFFTEYSLAVGGSEVGCRTIESIDWFQPLFNEAPELVDGQLVVPDRPGHGFTFDRKAVAHHAVD